MTERPSRAAFPVSFGLALIGVAVAWTLVWPDRSGPALIPFGVGLCFLVWGVHALVDVVERAARRIVERD